MNNTNTPAETAANNLMEMGKKANEIVICYHEDYEDYMLTGVQVLAAHTLHGKLSAAVAEFDKTYPEHFGCKNGALEIYSEVLGCLADVASDAKYAHLIVK